jgi:hypothetical protein
MPDGKASTDIREHKNAGALKRQRPNDGEHDYQFRHLSPLAANRSRFEIVVGTGRDLPIFPTM